MARAGDTLDSSDGEVDKTSARREARRRRAAVPRSARLPAARRATRALLRALPKRSRIAVYLAIGAEFPTAPLIAALRRAGHAIHAPLALRDWQLRFVPLRTRAVWRRRGRLRLQEPVRTRPRLRAAALDVIVLPLLGFDADGNRLGQGGGYYDRELAAAARRVRRPWLVGWAYAAQEFARLPCDPWDQPLDAVVTERGLRRFDGRRI